MRRLFIDDICGGELLAKDLYDINGKFIMAKGTVLKKAYVNTLKSFKITQVIVENELLHIEESIIESLQTECCDRISEIIEKFSYCGNVELQEIVEVAERIITDVISEPKVLYSVYYMREKSLCTYSHAVNVCALSVFIGIQLQLPDKKLHDMAVGALLHDIGYAYLPTAIRNKPVSEYTASDIKELRNHVTDGYLAVEGEDWLSELSKDIILKHHEYYDGSGYPFPISGEKIRTELNVICLCNEFDACVYGHFRKQLKAHEALDYIISEAGRKFELTVVRVFMNSVAIYPIGTYVLTNDGELGVVIRQNTQMPVRPIIKILYDRTKRAYKEEKIVNLVENLSVKIVDTTETLPASITVEG